MNEKLYKLRCLCTDDFEDFENRCKENAFLATACAEKLVFMRVVNEWIQRENMSEKICDLLLNQKKPLEFLYSDQVACDMYQTIESLTSSVLRKLVNG